MFSFVSDSHLSPRLWGPKDGETLDSWRDYFEELSDDTDTAEPDRWIRRFRAVCFSVGSRVALHPRGRRSASSLGSVVSHGQ